METVGTILKLTRNLKNISLQKISTDLKISVSILEKIENDEIVKNPDVVFYIGHIKSYCNFLELDSQIIINKFKSQISFNEITKQNFISKPIIKNNSIINQNIFSLLIIFVIFTSFYFLFISEDNTNSEYALIPDLPEDYIPAIELYNMNNFNSSQETKIKNSELDIIDENRNFSSAIASDKVHEIHTNQIVTLKLINPTWLQIRDKNDNIIISKLMDKNEEYSYDIDLKYNITAGNAGNILVIIDRDLRGKIGKYGEVVDSIILDKNFEN